MRRILSSPTTLDEVPAGACVRFERATGTAAEAAHLAALGVRTGARLEVRRRGEPCIVTVDCSRLALAGEIARRILVRPEPAAG